MTHRNASTPLAQFALRLALTLTLLAPLAGCQALQETLGTKPHVVVDLNAAISREVCQTLPLQTASKQDTAETQDQVIEQNAVKRQVYGCQPVDKK